MTGEEAQLAENIRQTVSKIWKRARMNAFAHKIAARRAQGWETIFVVASVVLALAAITSVILLYVLSAPLNLQGAGEAELETLSNWGTVFTLGSVGFTITGIGLQTLQVHFRFGVKSTQHLHYLGSFQHIAQRSREVEWPGMPYEQMAELLRDLERDFQLLKARGLEPRDSDFDEALVLFKKIQDDDASKPMQSFSS